MFFKADTIYKAFKTQRGAQAYINRWLSRSATARIVEINDKFWVVG